jgi:hypothetical protein
VPLFTTCRSSTRPPTMPAPVDGPLHTTGHLPPSSNHDVPSRSPPVPARPVSISDLVHRDPVAAMLRWPCTRPLLRPRRRP